MSGSKTESSICSACSCPNGWFSLDVWPMDKVLWLPPEYYYYCSPFLYSSWIGVEGDGSGGVAQLSTLCVNPQSLILIREVM